MKLLRINYFRGQKLGYCNYIEEAEKKNGQRHALFQCRCGKLFIWNINAVKSGYKKSCGCTSITARKHGLASHYLYQRWCSMLQRCTNENNPQYKDYGARGITVFDPWKKDPGAYIKYILSLPNAMQQGLSIDRIRNNEGYKPGNLRWATHSQQRINSRKR